MKHRDGDRYLPVRIFPYPIHGRGRSIWEYGYVYNAELHETLVGAERAGGLEFGMTQHSIAQIRDEKVVAIIDPDGQRDCSDEELSAHTEHLQWVWTKEE